MSSINFKNLLELPEFTREALNEELRQLNNRSGWLSSTTIMIICNIWNIRISIGSSDDSLITSIGPTVSNMDYPVQQLNGGLYYNGRNHWDTFKYQ